MSAGDSENRFSVSECSLIPMRNDSNLCGIYFSQTWKRKKRCPLKSLNEYELTEQCST